MVRALIRPTPMGRPFATMVENFRGQENERKAWRATGYYELDFADQSDDFSWLEGMSLLA